MSAAGNNLHTGAWVAWALGAATVAATARNPLYQLPLLAVIAAAYLACHVDAPWARAFRLFLGVGAVVLVARVLLSGLLGGPGGPVLLHLPELRLPGALGGGSIGGAVSAGALATGFREGLTVLVLVAAFGAFNACARPSRLLRLVPGFLFEAGLVVTVALAFVPQTVVTAGRVLEAQRLRGHRPRGVRDLGPLLVPLLAGGLERALTLAEAMEARGYGRRGTAGGGSGVLAVAGLVAVAVGAFALLGGSAAGTARTLLGAGAAVLLAAAVLTSRRSPRTRYRSERWRPADSAVAAGALAAAAVAVASLALGSGDLGWRGAPTFAAPGFSWPLGVALFGLAAPVAFTSGPRAPAPEPPHPAGEPGRQAAGTSGGAR